MVSLMYRLDGSQQLKPISIWLDDKILTLASGQDGYGRSLLTATIRTEIARFERFRTSLPCDDYQTCVELGDGFLTVIAIGDHVYFKYHVGEPLDPVPPRPPLSAPNLNIGRLCNLLFALKAKWKETIGFELGRADSNYCLH